jgi:hypothetical protein
VGDIIPPYIRQRIRVATVFDRYIGDAVSARNSPLAAVLEALCAEVLDTLDPSEGGDTPRI